MDYQNYLSPFSWRYGTPEMRHIWSEENKRKMWREVWVALATAQAEFGLVNKAQLSDLQQHVTNIDIKRALEIEAEIKHDLMAEIKTYAEQCKIGGGILHLGATSMDISDNAEALRIQKSLAILLGKLHTLLTSFAHQIETHADLTVMGHTHIQPAEPTTFGYRLAQYGQDLLMDWEAINSTFTNIKGKGFKGAVGTSASFAELIGEENLLQFEQIISENLNLEFFTATTQTYPRKQEYQIINAIAGLGGSLYKFAFDLRILQSPPFGEISEPFGKKQVGSSAMPFKRNPITAEKINSLGRALAQYPRLAWDNAAHSLLERTLDDSANRRTMLPETFLLADELLRVTQTLIDNLTVNQAAIDRNMATYGPFAATERVLMAIGKVGGDRQEYHECIREHALNAWAVIQEGQSNPLTEHLSKDKTLLKYLKIEEIKTLMEAESHTGDASKRAKMIAHEIKTSIDSDSG